MLEVFSIEVKLAKSSEFVGSLVSISYYIHMISALLATSLIMHYTQRAIESHVLMYLS